MSYKAWSQILLSCFLCIILLTMVLNFILDPFQYFRPGNYVYSDLNFEKSKYINVGMARHLSFKEIVIGSSHSKNIPLDQLSSKLNFESPIKLSMAGGSAHDQSMLLHLIFNHTIPKIVLYQLDVSSFQGSIERASPNLPKYLYKESINSTAQYITDSNVKKESLLRLSSILLSHIGYKKETSGIKDIYIEDFSKRSEVDLKEQYKYHNQFYLYNTLIESFDYNFLSHIKENPETKFIIYHPPFSILYYKSLAKNDSLNSFIRFKKYIYDETRSLDNVEIHDFQAIKSITHNLNNYSDITHFHSFVNDTLIDFIAEKRFLTRDDNIDRFNKLLLDQVLQY